MLHNRHDNGMFRHRAKCVEIAMPLLKLLAMPRLSRPGGDAAEDLVTPDPRMQQRSGNM
jgi:hypothetical protein